MQYSIQVYLEKTSFIKVEDDIKNGAGNSSLQGVAIPVSLLSPCILYPYYWHS